MTHVSRPVQLALVVFGLFAIVWFVTLRGHSSPSSNASSASAPTQPPKSHDSASASKADTSAPSHGAVHSHTSVTVHGSHGTVHSHTSVTVHGSHGTVHASSSSIHTDHVTRIRTTTTDHLTKTRTTTTDHVAKPRTASTRHAAGGAPAMQVAVERQLAQNKTVVILFWSPRGAEDIAVRQQVPIAARALGGSVAVHYALPHQVTEYGKITNTVQVNQTPTILIVNKRAQATTLTGLTDAFAIEQAVAEARTS